jgi:hypothetical protein
VRIAVGFRGVRFVDVRIDGAPFTVRMAAALVTFPETARMCVTVGVWLAFCAVPAPSVTGLPSEVQEIGAVKRLLFWS